MTQPETTLERLARRLCHGVPSEKICPTVCNNCLCGVRAILQELLEPTRERCEIINKAWQGTGTVAADEYTNEIVIPAWLNHILSEEQ